MRWGMLGSARKNQLEKISQPEISIKSELASSIVILAKPDEGLYELSSKLLEFKKRGYKIHHFFRHTPDGVYSRDLDAFMGRLEMGGYTRGDFRNYHSLNEHGVGLLKEEILEHFVEEPDKILKFARDAELDLNSLICDYLRKYLELINPWKFKSLPNSSASP